MEERLDKVKQAWEKRDWDTLLDRKDIHWLIKQAEKVERHEKALADIVDEHQYREGWMGQDGSDARFALGIVDEIKEKVNA